MNEQELNARRLGVLCGLNPYSPAFNTQTDKPNLTGEAKKVKEDCLYEKTPSQSTNGNRLPSENGKQEEGKEDKPLPITGEVSPCFPSVKQMEYKLFNTDGKTFFDFRSRPDSRCEGFTITYCDDGTVVMSGDYGTLCWKRNYHHEGDKTFHYDYGFPNKETGINYFEEKVCQFGVQQKVREFNKEHFIKKLKEYYGDNPEWNQFEEEVEYVDDNDEWKMHDIANTHFTDVWELEGDRYTEQFIFMFRALQSVSEQIWEAVINQDKKEENN
jgi:hypothetical protein